MRRILLSALLLLATGAQAANTPAQNVTIVKALNAQMAVVDAQIAKLKTQAADMNKTITALGAAALLLKAQIALAAGGLLAAGVGGAVPSGVCVNAPAGSAQFPSILSGYTKVPTWQVVGVNCAAGIPSGTVLTDWQAISQPGVSVNAGTGLVTVTCSSGAVTLTGIDFSLHGGAYIVDNTNGCNLTITTSKFGNTPAATAYTIHFQSTSGNLTVTKCDFTGGNSTYGAFVGYQTSGNVTFQYNYFHQGSQHIIEQVAGSMVLDYRFNLIYDMATQSGAHNNWLQWGTIGASTTVDVEYNTAYNDVLASGVSAGEGFQFYANNSGTLSLPTTLAFNTMIAKQYLSAESMSYIVHGDTISGATGHDNYFDITGAFGAFYPGSFTGWTLSSNWNMSTGAALSNTP